MGRFGYSGYSKRILIFFVMTSQYFGKEDFGNGKCKRRCWWNQVELHGGVHEILSFTEKMAASNTREAAPAWLNCTAINTNNLKEIHDKIRVLNLNARIEKHATTVDETSHSFLKYRTPNFRFLS
jgi:hypothetical protein